MNKKLDIPAVFGNKIVKKLNSFKTEKEREEEIEQHRNELKDYLEALKASERIRRDKTIHEWLISFLSDPLMLEVFQHVRKIEIYACLFEKTEKSGNFIREALILDTETKRLTLVNGFLDKKTACYVGLSTELKELKERLTEETLERFYRSIKNGKIWQTIDISLRENGFLE